ncbi:MAG: hypothetical protein ACD_79C00385G0005 [uncultured bacterium]|nr:MAG: hypothetical protein ACD_79C00385G0005 [uncultured bacterium]
MPIRKDVKVLVVDDSITVREIMKRQLKDIGIEVIKDAKNGEEGLVVFKQFIPDITFLDINMPIMNGVEVLSKIIAFKPDANVIMLSSLGTKEKINDSLERGAKNFLMKPVENDSLEKLISELTN